jgi:predicted PurR-regulated permease PerM
MNEKNISIVILGTIWLFVIAIFVVSVFIYEIRELGERIKALEKTTEEVDSVLEELYEELDKALEKTTNTVSVIETIKNAQFGIGTIVHRLENNGVYYYTIKIDNDTAVISSKDLFSVNETVIVCRIENTLFLIDIS